VYEQFADMSQEELKGMLGYKPDMQLRAQVANRIQEKKAPSSAKLPVDFDACKQWPGSCHPVRNQGQCGR
jgi:hypothetical protein